MDKLKVGLIGSTGVVGSVFARLLADHPYFDLVSVYASDRSAGQRYSTFLNDAISSRYESLTVKTSDPDTILKDRNDVIFSAVSEAGAGPLEIEISRRGSVVFTNASANRMNRDVPLVVPEVNPDHTEQLQGKNGFIVANGNCSTIGLTLGLAPLTGFGINRVRVTTMQAISGAGYPGVPSLDIMSNLIPHIKGEEEKMAAESAKIFGSATPDGFKNADFRVSATCIRAPVRDGHLESVSVVLNDEPDIRAVRKSIHEFRNGKIHEKLPTLPEKSIILRNEDNRPQPILDVMAGSPERAAGMGVTLGRLRIDGNELSFVLLVHNLIRGAAGAAILNAEYLHKRRMI